MRGSGLDDSSREASAKVVLSMGAMLCAQDGNIFKRAIGCGLAFDERDQLLQVFAQILTKKPGIYECLLGVERLWGWT